MARKSNSRPVSPVIATANPARVAADLERRRSNAARPIPARATTKRGGRAGAKRSAIRDAY